MDTLVTYRAKLKEIADYAFGHGFAVIGIKQFKSGPIDTWDKEILTKFYNACHDGFKIAQKLLIEEIKKYQAELRKSTAQLKEFRRKRDKAKEKETQDRINILEQRLHNFSHIADGIAWQLIGGQIHIARRFHIQVKSSKFLDSSNIEHAIQVAEAINQTPSDFALISDLTSFVQIGDLLVRHGKIIAILELKEGKVNDQIAEFLKKVDKVDEEVSEEDLKKKFDDNTVKQIKRIQRQQQRAVRATDVINNDKGIDPVSGGYITVSTPRIETVYFDEELSKLYEDLKEKIWAYTVIDTCVHIGMYRDKGVLMAGIAIEEILKQQTENYLIIDWLSITHNLSQPLFAKPFPPDFIIDILTGKVKVIIGLNGDALIETFNLLGLKSRWLTEKETAKQKQIATTKGIVVINKKGIVVTQPSGQEITIFEGTLSKILYDNIKPSCVALSILSIDNPDDTKETHDNANSENLNNE